MNRHAEVHGRFTRAAVPAGLEGCVHASFRTAMGWPGFGGRYTAAIANSSWRGPIEAASSEGLPIASAGTAGRRSTARRRAGAGTRTRAGVVVLAAHRALGGSSRDVA